MSCIFYEEGAKEGEPALKGELQEFIYDPSPTTAASKSAGAGRGGGGSGGGDDSRRRSHSIEVVDVIALGLEVGTTRELFA